MLAYQSANAQTETPETPSTGESQDSDQDDPTEKAAIRGLRGGLKGGASDEDLADALGITVDELEAAYEQAYDAALTQAVDAGLITQAQADQLRERSAAFPFGGRWGPWLDQSGIDFEALLADALGISVDQLDAAKAQAYMARIDQAVADGNLTQEQADLLKGEYSLYNNEDFQSTMQSSFEAAANQAVADGVITQAQADQILETNQNLFQRGFGGFGGFKGGRGRHGGFGHGDWFGPGAPVNPETPEAAPSEGA
jgi:hypothetical protein